MNCALPYCALKRYKDVLCLKHYVWYEHYIATPFRDRAPISRTSEYRIWAGMNSRCHNPKNPNYKYYGGRGIVVDELWRHSGGFILFIEHVGSRPSKKHSIDRINNDGNYEPGNVRWATIDVQANNRRPPKRSKSIIK